MNCSSVDEVSTQRREKKKRLVNPNISRGCSKRNADVVVLACLAEQPRYQNCFGFGCYWRWSQLTVVKTGCCFVCLGICLQPYLHANDYRLPWLRTSRSRAFEADGGVWTVVLLTTTGRGGEVSDRVDGVINSSLLRRSPPFPSSLIYPTPIAPVQAELQIS